MGNTTYACTSQGAVRRLTTDPDIVLIGEEVGRYGGAYGVTKGLLTSLAPNASLIRQFPNLRLSGLLWAAMRSAPVAE